MGAVVTGTKVVFGNEDDLICRVVQNLALPESVKAVKLQFRPNAAAVAVVRTEGKLVRHSVKHESGKFSLGPVISANAMQS